jgi:hypothetical protein
MKIAVTSLDDVPEALRGEYEEKDGKFYMKLEGEPKGYVKESDLAEANAKLVEFRDNNRGLKSQVDQLKSKYEGIDLDEYKKLKEKIAELEKRGVKGGEDVTSIVQKAIESAVTPLQKKIEEITEREKEANEALAKRDLESMLTKSGLEAGIAEKAMADYLRRGLEIFRMEEDGPVAMNGDTPLFCKDNPTKPLTIDEWAAGLTAEAPHLFKPSKGGGAAPGPGGNGDPTSYDRSDDADFLRNVEKIAKGEMASRETP